MSEEKRKFVHIQNMLEKALIFFVLIFALRIDYINWLDVSDEVAIGILLGLGAYSIMNVIFIIVNIYQYHKKKDVYTANILSVFNYLFKKKSDKKDVKNYNVKSKYTDRKDKKYGK